MTGFLSAHLFSLTGVILLALGLYAFVAHPTVLRKIIAFNVAASGIFLLFGAATRQAGGIDPVPQALIITSLVVAVATTALGVMLAVRLAGSREERTAGDTEEAGE